MSARTTIVDVSAFSLEGTSYLTSWKGASLAFQVETADGKPISRRGGSAQATKRSATLSVDLMSTVSGATKVNNLDLSEVLLGALDVTDDVRSLGLSVEVVHAEGSGVGDGWKYPNAVGLNLSATMTLAVRSTAIAVPDLLTGSVADLDVVLDFTLNGANLEIPMLITGMTHQFSENEIQTWELTLEGKSPDSGNFPTVPTGSTSLLEKAINAPGTPLTLVLTDKATTGTTYGGEFIFTSASFTVEDNSLVPISYEFASQGPVTGAVPSP